MAAPIGALTELEEKAQMRNGHVETFGFQRRKDQERRPWNVWEAPNGKLYAFDSSIQPLVTQHVRGGPYLGGMVIPPDHFRKKGAY